jgi:hypothetical protein
MQVVVDPASPIGIVHGKTSDAELRYRGVGIISCIANPTPLSRVKRTGNLFVQEHTIITIEPKCAARAARANLQVKLTVSDCLRYNKTLTKERPTSTFCV